AGPGSAVSAGLVPFAIGSETLGSIVSPSTRNGITGHRPTFGTVSRYGAMTLCWSMDKLGPMARSAEDCALIYEAIRGRDPRDASTVETAFPFEQGRDAREFRVGYYASAFEEDYENKTADLKSLEILREIGFDPVPVELPKDLPVDAALLTLSVEAAAAFDDLTRSGASDQMVRQTRNAWPHVFRTARFVTAVEFLQANRVRTQIMRRASEAFRLIDVLVTPTFGGSVLGITNLTGHPCVCVPNDFGTTVEGSERRRPGSISFIGGLYKDAEALHVAHAYQQATDFHRRRPPLH
ncbi:MAG: amidase, partial [Rhodothermales bacterium]